MNFEKVRVIATDGRAIKAKINIAHFDTSVKISIIPEEEANINEIILFDSITEWKNDDIYYGDGYTMLSQYGGTVANPHTITYFSDANHYKMPQTENYHTSYNYVYTGNDIDGFKLYGAMSCKKFRTEFKHCKNSLIISQSLENLVFKSGEEIQLEEIGFWSGKEIAPLLDMLAIEIEKNHPVKIYDNGKIPMGWCSWYCCGPEVTENDIFNALNDIKQRIPELQFIQIDDGFQPYMGDWLMTGSKFGRYIGDICRDIKKTGFEPAIWLAPFIASKKSNLFTEHPDWFIKDEFGNPLCSADVTFGGWRDAPWYFLDGTHPQALEYIYNVGKTIRNEWKVKYYKLDANVWGALPFGFRYDKTATAAEAYRRGMEAFWNGVGDDAYVLGCNAPMWASLGTVSGMRVTGDIGRSRDSVRTCAIEGFSRNWMHNRFWINDPDCIVMADTNPNVMDSGGSIVKSEIESDMFEYQNIYIKASGGAVLSGDYIDKLNEKDIAFLKKIIKSQKEAAVFNANLSIGTINSSDKIEYFIFNHDNTEKIITIKVNADHVINQYSGEKIKACNGTITLKMNPISAKWLSNS